MPQNPKTMLPCLRRSGGYSSTTYAVVLLSISLIVNTLVVLYQLRVLLPWEKSYTYIDHDHPRELPLKLRTVNMAFSDDPEHYPITGVRAWAEWNAIRPPGGGDVFLGPHPDLPFSVAMWHQLHCLNHIRAVIVNGDDGSIHTEHCFNYIRQALLCRADTTLEEGGASMVAPDGRGTVAPAYNMTHTCRDWTQVYDWTLEQHKKWTPEMVELQKGVANSTVLAHTTTKGM